jgi:hypothetical protein
MRLTGEEYADVRSDPRRFAVLPGHETSESGSVISRTGRYLVIQKARAAAAMR